MTVANLPTTMTIIQARQPGGPDVLEPTTRAVPAPGPGEVLVKVAAAGVNRPDLHAAAGQYPPPPGASDMPGLEVAGVIVAVGHSVSRWRVGDRVMRARRRRRLRGVLRGARSRSACRCRAGSRLDEAAALPETFFTVWTNVFERGRLGAGETLLVHGGASGIGTTAIQLARASARACSRRRARARNAGRASGSAPSAPSTIARGLRRRPCTTPTDGRGVDVVLDMVGGDYVSRNLEVLAMEGRLLQIAFLHGPHADVNLSPLMQKRITFTGSTLRPRTVEEKGAIARGLERDVWPLIESGEVRPVLHAVFPLAEASLAHAELEAGQHWGRSCCVRRPEL